jgi:hypothetical protein
MGVVSPMLKCNFHIMNRADNQKVRALVLSFQILESILF